MIKIIYRDLSPGLHAFAQAEGRNTVISLRPGLTPDQRRAALRRVQQSGRMGHGPRVSAVRLALARGVDRVKATACTGAAVVRLHPAGSALPAVLLSAAAFAFVLMATASIHALPASITPGRNPVVGAAPGPASSLPRPSDSVTPSAGLPAGARRDGTVPGPPASRQQSRSGGLAASGRLPAVDTSGVTQLGTVPGKGGTVTVTGPSADPGGSATGTSGVTGSGGTSGSGTSGAPGVFPSLGGGDGPSPTPQAGDTATPDPTVSDGPDPGTGDGTTESASPGSGLDDTGSTSSG